MISSPAAGEAWGTRPLVDKTVLVMRSLRLISSSLVLLLIVCVATVRSASAQQRESRPEDVVRVNTELVQTDVMVFAKDGSFVDGLKREQFETKKRSWPQLAAEPNRTASQARRFRLIAVAPFSFTLMIYTCRLPASRRRARSSGVSSI